MNGHRRSLMFVEPGIAYRALVPILPIYDAEREPIVVLPNGNACEHCAAEP